MLTGPMTKRLSNATNAYDLLTDVIAYMLEEPKRVYMGDWIIGNNDVESMFNIKGPACGTVGCIAGNVAVLTDYQTSPSNAEIFLSGSGGKQERLRRGLLGMFFDTEVPARYGTKKYAQIVAKRIRAFQRKWGDDLQAVAIKPPKRRAK